MTKMVSANVLGVNQVIYETNFIGVNKLLIFFCIFYDYSYLLIVFSLYDDDERKKVDKVNMVRITVYSYRLLQIIVR